MRISDMHLDRKKIGLVLSFLAVLWMLIPCVGHCALLSSNVPISHNCCETQEKPFSTSDNSNHSNNGLKQICISMAESYTVPVLFHYVELKTIVFKSTDMVQDVVQFLNITFLAHFWTIHSPPLIIAILLLTTHLYTPHAPPSF